MNTCKIKLMKIIIIIIATILTSCATVPQTIPVVTQPEYPVFVMCPALPTASDINASNVADMIGIIIANYKFCANEVDIAIKFKEEMSK